jgi:hypothetical protein
MLILFSINLIKLDFFNPQEATYISILFGTRQYFTESDLSRMHGATYYACP